MIPSIPAESQEFAMREPLFSSGVAENLLRICRFVLPAVLAFSAVAASAQQLGGAIGSQQQPSFVGQWRGVYSGITITITIQPNGQYTQTAQSRTLMTEQSGPYKLFAPNTIAFSVTNWAPKTMPVYHATGTVGGYYTQQPLVKPPGAVDTYVFKGANTVVLTDQMTHGSITMTRVQ
jgi:hypothetical protein